MTGVSTTLIRIAMSFVVLFSGIVSLSDAASARKFRKLHVKHPHVVRHHRVARRVATGVAVGTTIAASHRHYCRDLAYRCNRGNAEACIKHDLNCY
jgi:hypothetical protein